MLTSSAFHEFWQGVQDFTNVQDVIDNYETKVTTNFLDAGFRYKTVFDTIHEDNHRDALSDFFSYYNPTAILRHKVPFIKVETIAKQWRDYAFIFLTSWSSIGLSIRLDSQPHVYDRSSDYPYLLSL